MGVLGTTFLVFSFYNYVSSHIIYYSEATRNHIFVKEGEKPPDGYILVKSPVESGINVDNEPEPKYYCQENAFHCNSPFSYERTKLYRCEWDVQCPDNYRCCKHFCFQHRICGVIPGIPENKDETTATLPSILTSATPYSTILHPEVEVQSIISKNSKIQTTEMQDNITTSSHERHTTIHRDIEKYAESSNEPLSSTQEDATSTQYAEKKTASYTTKEHYFTSPKNSKIQSTAQPSSSKSGSRKKKKIKKILRSLDSNLNKLELLLDRLNIFLTTLIKQPIKSISPTTNNEPQKIQAASTLKSTEREETTYSIISGAAIDSTMSISTNNAVSIDSLKSDEITAFPAESPASLKTTKPSESPNESPEAFSELPGTSSELIESSKTTKLSKSPTQASEVSSEQSETSSEFSTSTTAITTTKSITNRNFVEPLDA